MKKKVGLSPTGSVLKKKKEEETVEKKRKNIPERLVLDAVLML
jgi:hypothetical protein